MCCVLHFDYFSFISICEIEVRDHPVQPEAPYPEEASYATIRLRTQKHKRTERPRVWFHFVSPIITIGIIGIYILIVKPVTVILFVFWKNDINFWKWRSSGNGSWNWQINTRHRPASRPEKTVLQTRVPKKNRRHFFKAAPKPLYYFQVNVFHW